MKFFYQSLDTKWLWRKGKRIIFSGHSFSRLLQAFGFVHSSWEFVSSLFLDHDTLPMSGHTSQKIRTSIFKDQSFRNGHRLNHLHRKICWQTPAAASYCHIVVCQCSISSYPLFPWHII